MKRTWTSQFVWYNEGQGILELGPPQGVRVAWTAAQSVAGKTFIAVRPLPEEPLGGDLGIILEFARSPTIVGMDIAGRTLRASTNGRTNPVDAADPDEGWITFRVQEIECSAPAPAPAPAIASFRFALSNISQEAPPDASWMAEGVVLTVSPACAYEDVVSTLATRDRFGHTAYLSVDTNDRACAVRLAETTCALLSLITGCRVSWLHLEGLDASGAVTDAWVSNAITGPFLSLPVIEEARRWGVVAEHWQRFADFYAAHRLHARRLIGLLLNATADDDFLEVRGAKLATTVEALTTVVVGNPVPTGFATQADRRAFRNAVQTHVEAEAKAWLVDDTPGTPGVKEQRIDELKQKVNNLFHPTFRQQIAEMHRVLQLDMDADQVRRFVTSRNELVHEVRFVCQRDTPPDDWPHRSPAAEYFAMLLLVDRLLLRTIGYRGPFVDRAARDGTLAPAEPLLDVDRVPA